MKQTLNFENDAYRRLCGELVKRRHPGRWIICGAFAVVIMAAAVSLTFFANTPVTAESPLRGMETEQEEIAARVEPLPEVITRTHTETVTVPVQVTITQESVTEPSMTEPYLMATLSEPIAPDSELISYDEKPWSTNALEPIRAGDFTISAESDCEHWYFSWKNEQTEDSNRFLLNGFRGSLRWYWTGDELFLALDECYRYCPGDLEPKKIDYSQVAELLRYRWTYRGEDYTYFTKGKTLYRRQESSGKEVALYRSDNPLAIVCLSGRYLFFDEVQDDCKACRYYNQIYRVDLLTGEKNSLFTHQTLFPYYGKDGEDLLFISNSGRACSSSMIRVHPDGNFQAEDLPITWGLGYHEIEPPPDVPQKARVILRNDDDSFEVDLTDEVLEMYPDADVTMNSSFVYYQTGKCFCAKIFEIREYKNQYAVLGVYIGCYTENGIIGNIQTIVLPEFDGYFSHVNYLDTNHYGNGIFFDIGEICITIEVWNDSIGDYEEKIISVPYDHPATPDGAE